jgi:oxygen-independent coproporphyrinogen-3 oxidase
MATVFELSPRQRAVYRRFADLALPRHTSYPSVAAWTTEYGPGQFRADLGRAARDRRPLALYVHVPFCEKLCYYCACTKEIVPEARRRHHDPAEDFLVGLDLEVQHLGAILGGPVQQIHLGGGSPTFLHVSQLQRLWHIITRHLPPANDAEVAIEIDPRITSREQLEVLRGLGFNRISLGVQDFSDKVQRAVNRRQSFDRVREVVAWCRELRFASINFDLIYGLPFQTVASMADTLDKTLALAPDRIAFFRLAVIPEIFCWQNTFRAADLPSGELSLDLNLLAINRFLKAGYEFIGLDHFARPDEPLAQACRDRTLQRNFQGVTTGKHLDLIGIGPSAISHLENAFAQNHKSSADWGRAVSLDLPTARGRALSQDDRLRGELLQQLYGHGIIDKGELETRFGISFDNYFGDELERLRVLAEEGLVDMASGAISVTPVLGRLLVRVVATLFDGYLPRDAYLVGLPSNLASRVG